MDKVVDALGSRLSIYDYNTTELSRLAESLRVQFERTGNITDLNAAIGHQTRAISITEETNPEYPLLLNSLGVLLVQRFVRTGNLADVHTAIERQEKALNLLPEGDPNKFKVWDKLGISLRRRYERLGDPSDIDSAIDYQSQASSLASDLEPEKGSILNNLGNSFGLRFERSGNLDDIRKAIEAQTKCIEVTPGSSNAMPKFLNNLGNSFWRRYHATADVEDLDKAIKHRQKAVALSPDGYPEKHRFVNNLAVAFLGRFERLHGLDDLLQAIRYQEEVLKLRPVGHADRSTPLNNLSNCLWRQYQRSGILAQIDQAISYQQEAIQCLPDGHARKPVYLINLAISLLERYPRLYNQVDLDRAIVNLQQAVNLLPDGHTNKSRAWQQLGNAHRFAFRSSRNKLDIDNAVDSYRLSALSVSAIYSGKAQALSGLGCSFIDRYHLLGDIEDINEAIKHHHDSLALVPEDSIHFPPFMTNLASAFAIRFKHSADPVDLDESIKCYEKAILATPKEHPSLASLLAQAGYAVEHRFQLTNSSSDFDQAAEYFEKATKTDRSPASHRFDAARRWISLLNQQPGLPVLEPYQLAMNFLPAIMWQGMSISDRYRSAGSTVGFVNGAAAAAVKAGEYSLAIEWLEQGRSIVWSQILQLRQPIHAVHAANPVIARQYDSVVQELEAARRESGLGIVSDDPITMEAAAQKQRRLAEQWNGLLQYFIRKVPGFEDFLKPQSFARLASAAHKGPIVVVNVHEVQCDALAILADKSIVHIPLPLYSHEKATRAYNDWVTNLKRFNVRSRGVRRESGVTVANRSPFARVLRELWEEVVQPILESLDFMHTDSGQSLPRLTWCTTGPLSLLPIHAAGNYDSAQPRQRTFDYVISSYAPSISSLLQTSQQPLEFHGMLAVGQENTPQKSSLPYVSQEIDLLQKAVSGVDFESIVGADATVDTVLQKIEQCSWVHLACHASQDTNDPNTSGFYLQDGKLDLATITKKPLKYASFAYLSACETATGHTELPDEAIHLTAGMLMAGFSTVIGTMWSIKDEYGPVIAERVYTELLRNGVPDHRGAAEALHKAIAYLRDLVGEEKYEDWASFIHVGV
ncbi:CHAT domain protein [Ceratobasidium sp. AG-Ba]|nr:CHAT domain protein [Ceratobasidium sp. AG-Ba]